ncbi:MAG TPA: hypothetical protein VM869_35990, partial [Enhygromyxa sp.]|nr:hypothetical protein [Enhygromyxa sp.]
MASIGLAFVVGNTQRFAEAGGGPICVDESMCSFKRPNVMFIVDYSTSMNTIWDLQNDLTRWEIVVTQLGQVTAPGSFLSQNTHLALLRFGHDPAPGIAGTTIPNETSGLVDGQALDVAWDDANHEYFDCAGEAIGDALASVPAPMMGAQAGIGSWTKGALDRAAAEIDETKADHPEDQQGPSSRRYVNVLLTDGLWTGADGNTTQSPAGQNPAIAAQSLYDDDGVPTYVVLIAGDAQAKAAA